MGWARGERSGESLSGDKDQMWELACVGAGLPAMQTPRYLRRTRLMPSQASQLPHKPAPPGEPVSGQEGACSGRC
ncbi:hypothetical protein BFW87_14590 [Pseudomonas fluorescens]|uniref:Uncharacterized protein n=1 Tax=Pseudomonas fluorescens TaxID=294 RepID=A0A1T2YT56_PSEFL|nr:hypothetical protein BFW87_14590 [Pseudomonas fluorescens]